MNKVMDRVKQALHIGTKVSTDVTDTKDADKKDPRDTNDTDSKRTSKCAAMEKELSDWCTLSYKQRIIGFVASFIGGMIMLIMSFMYVTLILVGKAYKFVVTYALANALLLGSSCCFVGPSTQLKSMFSKTRLGASLVYVSSMLLTLYSAFSIQSWYVVIPILIVQFASLLWYVASYIPFGRNCLSFIGKPFARSLLPT